MTENKIRFAHIRKDRHTSIGGGLTVAFYQDGALIKFSIASCAPKVHYNKKVGRTMALEALGRGEVCAVSIAAVRGLHGEWRDIKYPKDVIYALLA